MSTYQQFISDQSGYRKIVEDYYGIKILPGFDVHHKDMDHDNDDVENLIVLTRSGHSRWHALYDPNHSNNTGGLIRAGEVAHSLPRTEKQLSNLQKSWSGPRSDKQLEKSREHIKLALKANIGNTHAKANVGKIWLNNGNINKFVELLDFESGLYPGYGLGMLPRIK